jgi:hypothetical protein
MAMSDRRDGPAKHYVSRERPEVMLKHEFAQLLEGLKEKHGDTTYYVRSGPFDSRTFRARVELICMKLLREA